MISGINRAAPRWASLLDADPDLAEGLSADAVQEARRKAVAAVIELEPPAWDPAATRDGVDPASLGLFVLEGLLIRHVTVGPRGACELFGPGDLFRPWDSDSEYEPLPISIRWHVVRPTRVAVLDAAFALRIARWPSISGRIVGRLAHRARYLALTQAAMHLPRAGARLLILFWLLAERWGVVTRDGIRITLPLTHEILAMLVGTRRPTVTIALQRLARAGLLRREGHEEWMLSTDALRWLEEPASLRLIAANGGGESSYADALGEADHPLASGGVAP